MMRDTVPSGNAGEGARIIRVIVGCLVLFAPVFGLHPFGIVIPFAVWPFLAWAVRTAETA